MKKLLNWLNRKRIFIPLFLLMALVIFVILYKTDPTRKMREDYENYVQSPFAIVYSAPDKAHDLIVNREIQNISDSNGYKSPHAIVSVYLRDMKNKTQNTLNLGDVDNVVWLDNNTDFLYTKTENSTNGIKPIFQLYQYSLGDNNSKIIFSLNNPFNFIKYNNLLLIATNQQLQTIDLSQTPAKIIKTQELQTYTSLLSTLPKPDLGLKDSQTIIIKVYQQAEAFTNWQYNIKTQEFKQLDSGTGKPNG